MKNNELVYDEQIAPLMTQIIDICDDHGINLACEFQYADHGFCRTVLAVTDDAHPIIQHINVLTQCLEDGGINIDKYVFWAIRTAQEQRGHSSLVLKQLGIPEGYGASPVSDLMPFTISGGGRE